MARRGMHSKMKRVSGKGAGHGRKSKIGTTNGRSKRLKVRH
jgi:hypothetical protein